MIFNKIKEIMDEYYKEFIEKVLEKVQFSDDNLYNFYNMYSDLKKINLKDFEKKNKLIKQLEQYQKNLTKEIYNSISSNKNFKKLFKKELVKELLPAWLEEKGLIEELNLVNEFKNWVTYFEGFLKIEKMFFQKKIFQLPSYLELLKTICLNLLII